MGIVHMKLVQSVAPSWVSKLSEFDELSSMEKDTPRASRMSQEKYPNDPWRLSAARKKKSKAKHRDLYMEEERFFQTLEALDLLLSLKDLYGKKAIDDVPDVEGAIAKMFEMEGPFHLEYDNAHTVRGGRDGVTTRLPVDIKCPSVKNSVPSEQQTDDPYTEFKESFTEMILAHDLDIHDPDVEDLLYCYFSMNSPELHHTIEKAYWHAWIDLLSAFLIH